MNRPPGAFGTIPGSEPEPCIGTRFSECQTSVGRGPVDIGGDSLGAVDNLYRERPLAKKIASPPEGVTVEVDRARSIVRFVGPRTESASTSRSGPPTDTPNREAQSAKNADVRGRGQR